MNQIALDLGFIQIYWYSIFIFIALFIGGSLAIKEAKKFNIPEDFIVNMLFWGIPLAIIGARGYYVAFNWNYYSVNIIDIFKIWEGGLAIHGGILLCLIWILIYTKKYSINTLRILDISVISLIIGQAIGRWGNFFNQEAYGIATTQEFLQKLHIPNFIINGMNIDGVYYQPTFLYESLWTFLGFLILILIRKYRYLKLGHLTSLYLMWYSFGRFFIESLRTDSLMLGQFRIAQLVSMILFVIGLVVFISISRGSRFNNLYNEGENINESTI
jgi:phosphatidylglycerol---prolipoprotein diacylglyceryl transferase